MSKPKESDMLIRLREYITECSERELVELYNHLFKTDLHTMQIAWDDRDIPLDLPARN